MGKYFNVNGDCKRHLHYMINIENRLIKIKEMVDKGEYFTINRARQYGKTTTLKALKQFFNHDFIVINMDFQMFSASKFKNENIFSVTFAADFLDTMELYHPLPCSDIIDSLRNVLEHHKEDLELFELFRYLSKICAASLKPIVLMIDEVDSAANNQVFLDFLAQLRGYYMQRENKATFQSVILASVYDIKNIQQKFRDDTEHKVNSPWNIAADFLIDISFSSDKIAVMLEEYEKDHNISMDVAQISQLIYQYTSGYPYLVSKICKLMDERIIIDTEFPTLKSI